MEIKRTPDGSSLPGLFLCCTNFTLPTGSLDSYNAESVFDIMKQIAKEGTLVLMVTHDRGLAGQCEELFEMEKAGGIGICTKVHREG